MIPNFFASSNTFTVTFGGVMIDTEVSAGCGRAERFGRVGYSTISSAGKGGKALMEEDDGFMGVTGREWCVYHVNTDPNLVHHFSIVN